MPLKQLPVVKKIKYLVSNIILSKKQILDVVQKDAEEHHLVNLRQERDDNARVNHALKDLRQENKANDRLYVGIYFALLISILINVILMLVIIFD